MIKVEKFSKAFGKTDAVHELTFNLRSGEVLGLLGPNGAGKTTTLRAIAGVLRADKGSISVGGFNVEKNPVEAKKLLAYLPDQSIFFEHLTCWEHVRFIGSVYEFADWENRANSLFERFELKKKKTVWHLNYQKE